MLVLISARIPSPVYNNINININIHYSTNEAGNVNS